MKEQALQLLADARRTLEGINIPPDEKDVIIKLIGILSISLEKYSQGHDDKIALAQAVINNQALLDMLRQQTEELDALKKLSINLTSSLDLPDVLDALVSEAMQLIENARDVNIFLYKDGKLSFGAALDSQGNKNTSWAKPRSNGLT